MPKMESSSDKFQYKLHVTAHTLIIKNVLPLSDIFIITTVLWKH